MNLFTQHGKFRLKSLLLIIILAAFALRLYQLDTQSLWYDETVSAFLAGQSPAALIAHTARDIHPPAYYLLLHFWAGAAGQSQFALAFFSLIFGILLIPLIYLLSRTLINSLVAAWAALLIAVSPFNIWYSQEVRMYTLGAVLGVVTVYYAVKALTGSGKTSELSWSARCYWLGYSIAAALGIYTLYYFIFLLFALNLFFLVYTIRLPHSASLRAGQGKTSLHPPSSILYPPSSILYPLFAASLLILILYLPWLPIAWRQAANPPVPPWRSPPELWATIVEGWTALSLGQSIEPTSLWPILLLTLGLLGLSIFYLHPTVPAAPFPPAWLLLTYIFGPLGLIYLLSWITPLYHVRYLFTYSPAFYILLAAGLAGLRSRISLSLAVGAAGLLVLASLYSLYQLHFNPRYQTDDYRAAVSFIQAQWQPGDAILVNAGYVYTAFLYYADSPTGLQHRRLVPYHSTQTAATPLLLQTGTVNGDPNLGWGDPQADFYPMDAAETTAALEQLSQEFGRLWLLRAYDTVTDPTGLIRQWLVKNAIPLEDRVFSGESNIRAQGFLLAGAPPPQNHQVLFEDGLVLAGWYVPDQTWQAGQTIPIKLWWMAAAPPRIDYKMSLKLWKPTGELAAQGQDQWPAGALYRATDWPIAQAVYQPTGLHLPPGLPAGQYWLNVELYHPETIQPLPRRDNGETVVTLGPVMIEGINQ